MPADWQDVPVAAGSTESADIAIPADVIVVPPGQVKDASGKKPKPMPDFDVVPSGDAGSKIVLTMPAAQDLVFQVKEGDDDEDEDDDAEPEQLPA